VVGAYSESPDSPASLSKFEAAGFEVPKPQ